MPSGRFRCLSQRSQGHAFPHTCCAAASALPETKSKHPFADVRERRGRAFCSPSSCCACVFHAHCDDVGGPLSTTNHSSARHSDPQTTTNSPQPQSQAQQRHPNAPSTTTTTTATTNRVPRDWRSWRGLTRPAAAGIRRQRHCHRPPTPRRRRREPDARGWTPARAPEWAPWRLRSLAAGAAASAEVSEMRGTARA